MIKEQEYISVEDAARELGVNRSTMYYYKRQLNIQHKKFPLDRRRYISLQDLERIKAAKKAATEGKH
jgi:transposase-like protein